MLADPICPGSTQDRQKSNSKDEDIPGYANEGFRFRDLETGAFLSRDPAGFVDGPNLYAYVKQNPWTSFDPIGLNRVVVSGGVNPEPKKDKTRHDKNWKNFVQAAKTEIESSQRKLKNGEKVEWLVQKESLIERAKTEGLASDFYTKQVEEIAGDTGAQLRWYNTKSEFVSAINTDSSGNDRAGSSLISDFKFFGHGSQGAIWLTYRPNPDGPPDAGIAFTVGDLPTGKLRDHALRNNPDEFIHPSAFSKNASAVSWACNSGVGDPSFAKAWSSSLDVDMLGLVGKSNYGPTSPTYGNSYFGGKHPLYPIPGNQDAGGPSYWRNESNKLAPAPGPNSIN